MFMWAYSLARKDADILCPLYRPENIPHLTNQQSGGASGEQRNSISGSLSLHPTTSQGQSGSPIKEPSILQRGMSVDEQEPEEVAKAATGGSEPEGVPIKK
jgi:hypothetical protein